MPNVIMGIETPPAEGGSRRKPKKAFRGRHRTLIRKLLHYAKAVVSADNREIERGVRLEYNGVTFTNTTVRSDALKNVTARCLSALDQTI